MLATSAALQSTGIVRPVTILRPARATARLPPASSGDESQRIESGGPFFVFFVFFSSEILKNEILAL